MWSDAGAEYDMDDVQNLAKCVRTRLSSGVGGRVLTGTRAGVRGREQLPALRVPHKSTIIRSPGLYFVF